MFYFFFSCCYVSYVHTLRSYREFAKFKAIFYFKLYSSKKVLFTFLTYMQFWYN
jgi:hypothetical protein